MDEWAVAKNIGVSQKKEVNCLCRSLSPYRFKILEYARQSQR